MQAGSDMRAIIKATILGLGLTSLAAPALADDATAALFGERQLALAIDTRCGLFTDAQRNALDAARLQARGLLLREGVSLHALDDYTRDLQRQAAGIACNDPAVGNLQHRVVEGFVGWVRIPAMDFPGAHFTWTSSRGVMPDMPIWSIVQDQGNLKIGVSTRDGQRQLSLALPGSERRATSAILVLRDMDRQPTLYDATMGGSYAGPTDAPWARWTPPRFAQSRHWASGRDTGRTAATLAGEDDATLFDFPMSAADAMAARDPRETARIELMDRHGNIVASHYIEIGDFAAALAFLRGADRGDTPS